MTDGKSEWMNISTDLVSTAKSVWFYTLIRKQTILFLALDMSFNPLYDGDNYLSFNMTFVKEIILAMKKAQ